MVGRRSHASCLSGHGPGAAGQMAWSHCTGLARRHPATLAGAIELLIEVHPTQSSDGSQPTLMPMGSGAAISTQHLETGTDRHELWLLTQAWKEVQTSFHSESAIIRKDKIYRGRWTEGTEQTYMQWGFHDLEQYHPVNTPLRRAWRTGTRLRDHRRWAGRQLNTPAASAPAITSAPGNAIRPWADIFLV